MSARLLETMLQFLHDVDISWLRYGIAILVVLSSIVAQKLVSSFLAKKLKSSAESAVFFVNNLFFAAINKPLAVIFVLGGIYLGLVICQLPIAYQEHIDGGFTAVLSCLILWILVRLSDILMTVIGDKLSATNDKIALQFIPLLRRALRVLLLIVGVIFIVQNIGVDVGSLLAGLGIGGLAVALAAQESLANFFGALVLLVDRPFKINDWIKINSVEGIVEEMGFRSTRIRTWERVLVTLPNKGLANATIENWTKMDKRRVRQTLAITYDSGEQKIQQFSAGLADLLQRHAEVEKDTIIVRFTDFNASSLDILVQYFTLTTVYVEFLRIKEQNNYAFLALAEQLRIDFAFPTQTLHVHGKEIT